MSEIVVLKNIFKEYHLGKTVVQALQGVDLTVQAGEFTTVIGPSGSGKTTLLNIIGCLDRPTSGEFWLSGQSIGMRDFDDLAEIRNRTIGFIFQSFNLIPVLNVYENIEFPCLIQKGRNPKELKAKIEQISKDVGLENHLHHRPDELSGGQRQRVAIARALATEPLLVLADEPTANLDSRTAQQIIDLMLKLNTERKVTFLFSTHDAQITKHARRVCHIADGKIVEGTSDGLLRPPMEVAH